MRHTLSLLLAALCLCSALLARAADLADGPAQGASGSVALPPQTAAQAAAQAAWEAKHGPAAAGVPIPQAAAAQPAPAAAVATTPDPALEQSVPVTDVPAQAPEAALQDVTQQLVALERDLSILEEDLLYPPSSRVAVYLSMDVGELFALDEVEVKINGTTVAHHLYTEQQVDALHRGGVQRLYVGNAKQGENEITAFFLGRGHSAEPLRRAVTAKFSKSFEPVYVELKIADSEQRQRPELKVEAH